MSGDVGADVAAVLDPILAEYVGPPIPHEAIAIVLDMAQAALAPLIAARVAAAKAEALREAADDFRSNAARAWGGRASWLTTGERVADLVADWLTESADDLRSSCPGDHAGPCFDGRPDLCADILRTNPGPRA